MMQCENKPFLIREEECTRSMHALITGSFDPVTVGHVDIVSRVAQRFEKVTAAVFVNAQKEYLLSLSEKIELLRIACLPFPNVRVTGDPGMVCDFCKANDVDVIVRGVRDEKDLAFELLSAEYNFAHSGVRTLLLTASEEYRHISSSFLKERLIAGESVGELLPKGVEEPFLNILLQQL